MFVRNLGGLVLLVAVCGYVAPAFGQVEAEDPAPAAETQHGAEGHSAEAHAADAGHAADGHGDAAHGNTNPLSIDPDLAIFTVLVFAVLLAVLRKFAWKPIMAGLERREEHVGRQLEEAERRNREAEEMLSRYQAELAQASDQVRQMLEEARQSAEASREQELARTQETVKTERERALTAIDAAKQQASQEVASKAADAAVALAGRIVRRDLSKADHAALVSQTMDQFSSRN
jgi:F-type H+-transporting ATPase subunit b